MFAEGGVLRGCLSRCHFLGLPACPSDQRVSVQLSVPYCTRHHVLFRFLLEEAEWSVALLGTAKDVISLLAVIIVLPVKASFAQNWYLNAHLCECEVGSEDKGGGRLVVTTRDGKPEGQHGRKLYEDWNECHLEQCWSLLKTKQKKLCLQVTSLGKIHWASWRFIIKEDSIMTGWGEQANTALCIIKLIFSIPSVHRDVVTGTSAHLAKICTSIRHGSSFKICAVCKVVLVSFLVWFFLSPALGFKIMNYQVLIS